MGDLGGKRKALSWFAKTFYLYINFNFANQHIRGELAGSVFIPPRGSLPPFPKGLTAFALVASGADGN
jgi:hypothetical protein